MEKLHPATDSFALIYNIARSCSLARLSTVIRLETVPILLLLFITSDPSFALPVITFGLVWRHEVKLLWAKTFHTPLQGTVLFDWLIVFHCFFAFCPHSSIGGRKTWTLERGGRSFHRSIWHHSYHHGSNLGKLQEPPSFLLPVVLCSVCEGPTSFFS